MNSQNYRSTEMLRFKFFTGTHEETGFVPKDLERKVNSWLEMCPDIEYVGHAQSQAQGSNIVFSLAYREIAEGSRRSEPLINPHEDDGQ